MQGALKTNFALLCYFIFLQTTQLLYLPFTAEVRETIIIQMNGRIITIVDKEISCAALSMHYSRISFIHIDDTIDFIPGQNL